MISQIFHPDCFKVLSIYGLSPGSRFNRTDFKKKTKLHNVPLDKALALLLNSGILKKEKKYYSIHFENEYTLKIIEIIRKQYRELRELPLTVYYLILDMAAFFSLLKGIEAYLFGSYAKLIYTEKSDVDIAIVHQKKFKREEITKIVSKIEKKYDKKIEIHYFEKDAFYKNKRDLLVKGILKDGVRLI